MVIAGIVKRKDGRGANSYKLDRDSDFYYLTAFGMMTPTTKYYINRFGEEYKEMDEYFLAKDMPYLIEEFRSKMELEHELEFYDLVCDYEEDKFFLTVKIIN